MAAASVVVVLAAPVSVFAQMLKPARDCGVGITSNVPSMAPDVAYRLSEKPPEHVVQSIGVRVLVHVMDPPIGDQK